MFNVKPFLPHFQSLYLDYSSGFFAGLRVTVSGTEPENQKANKLR